MSTILMSLAITCGMLILAEPMALQSGLGSNAHYFHLLYARNLTRIHTSLIEREDVILVKCLHGMIHAGMLNCKSHQESGHRS